MRLIIVRHGETQDNASGIIQGHNDGILTGKGISQAKDLGRYLKGERIACIFSSDLGRARDTAQHISSQLGKVPVVYDRRLRERDYRKYTGRRCSDVDWDALDRDEDPESIEPLGQVRARVMDLLTELLAGHAGETVLLIGHGSALKILIGAIFGEGLIESMRIKLDNASVTVIELDPRRKPVMVKANYCGYLPKK